MLYYNSIENQLSKQDNPFSILFCHQPKMSSLKMSSNEITINDSCWGQRWHKYVAVDFYYKLK